MAETLVFYTLLVFVGSASMFFSGAGLVLQKNSKQVVLFAILAIVAFVFSGIVAFEQGKREGKTTSSLSVDVEKK